MSPDSDSSEEQPKDDQEILQLPPVDPNASEDMPTLELNSGGSIKLESLGPIILNTDGTTRRISNWDQLSPQEQKVSWRRIRKRNEQRRKTLEEQAGQSSTESKEQGNELWWCFALGEDTVGSGPEWAVKIRMMPITDLGD